MQVLYLWLLLRRPYRDLCIFLQLCATKHGRSIIKSQNSHLILQALQNWESKNNVQELVDECEKLLQVYLQLCFVYHQLRKIVAGISTTMLYKTKI